MLSLGLALWSIPQRRIYQHIVFYLYCGYHRLELQWDQHHQGNYAANTLWERINEYIA